MVRWFTFGYFSLALFFSILSLFKVEFAIPLGNQVIVPFLAFYYFKFRIKALVYRESVMILLFCFGVISDFQYFFDFGVHWVAFQLFFAALTIFTYLFNFRSEGTFLSLGKPSDYFKFLWLVSTVLVFIIFLINEKINEFFLTGGLLYSLVEGAFILFAFFRKVNKWSYMFGLAGVACKFCGDMLFGLMSVEKPLLIYFLPNYLLYAISQYLLINSFLIHQVYVFKKWDFRSKNLEIKQIFNEIGKYA